MERGEREMFNVDMPGASDAMEQTEAKERAIEATHQNMEGFVNELAAESRFEKTAGEKGAEVLKSPEGEEFRVSRIENPFDPRVREVWKMMKEEFGDEADPLSWIRESIKQGINQYDVITNAGGEIVSFSNSRYLEMDPKEGNPPESLVYVAFVLTGEEYRRKGLAAELAQKLSAGTLEQAKEEGHAVKGIIGEATETSERFWNKIGERRLYFEDAKGNVQEVPYKAPPCDYDDKTGEPTVDGTFEHLMVRAFDGSTEFNVDDIVRMSRTIYFEEYGAEPSDYSSKEAWQKTQDVLDQYLKELETSMAGALGGKVFMMTAEERAQRESILANQGKNLVEVHAGE